MTPIPRAWNPTLRVAGLVITVALAGCAQRHRTPSPMAMTTRPEPIAEEVARLEKEVETLFNQGRFQEAIPLAARGLALREKTLGARHPDVAISLSCLARVHQARGAYTQAEPLFLRGLEIRTLVLGATHPDVAQSLNYLGNLYVEQGAYMRAELLLVRALDIREKALSATHRDVGVSLNSLARLYQEQGAYARAEPLHLRALDVFEKALGAMHPDVAASLNNLASLYLKQGEHARAEPLLVRALEIKEKALGSMHPSVATSLSWLGGLYYVQGAYARTEPLWLRALEIKEKALGAMHPDVAANLNALGELYRVQGTYARAEPLLVRALEIREKTLGSMHPDLASSLSNLALLFHDQGAYARAAPLLVRALDIAEKALGAMHPDIAVILSNLASVYHEQGMDARVEPLLVRALKIREQALGPMHPAVASSLNSLANLYQGQGAYARAESHYLRALSLREKLLGAMHPDVAAGLNNLAMLYLEQGAYARAEPLLIEALGLRERVLGATHPQVVESLQNLAGLYQARGMHTRAEPLLARAEELQEAHLRTELARLSESRKRDLMLLLQGETERLVSLHAHMMPGSPHARELALTSVLRRKGRVLDSLVDTQLVIRARLAPQSRDKLAELADAGALLSKHLHAPFDPRTAADQQVKITAIRNRIDKLEAELNVMSVELRVQSERVTVGKIQAALPRGTALVEIVRYRRFDGQQARARQRWREARYLAYILPSQGAPQWVALGEADRIDAAVDAMLAAMHKNASASAAKAALRNLDTLAFAPIRGRLGGVSHVILSPDGKLNLVPFEALIDPQGRYALEQRLVSYVTSGRDLLRLAGRQAPRSPATIIADPDYGPAGKPYVRVDGTTAEMYGQLAGTLAEANGIRGYFADARTLTQGQATKAALAAITGPAVLHIATHGFYTRAAGLSAMPPTGARERGMSVHGAALPPGPPAKVDPMEALDRAGLVLAGANVGPDGIISARELANRDLWGTQLVVLSACGTGLGEVSSGKGAHGEGVYGMRRALVLAGAQTQVVSLWNVNDSSAPELMRELYAELARGTGRAEALRRAKLRMLRQPRFAHPYYWAAFIAAGDWTPLDKGIMRPAEPAR